MDEIKFDGNKLFKIRKEKRLSQAKLASEVGVSRQTIYLWESNQSLPDVEKVSKICKALEVDLSELVNGIDIQNELEDLPKKEENRNSKKMAKIVKSILIGLLAIILCVYIMTSIIKFFRLNSILNKWEKLKFNNRYYIKVSEYLIDRTNKNDEILENKFYEIYYNDNILKTINKDSKDEKTVSVNIRDYNTKKRYIIDEKEKTYVVEKIDEFENTFIITENFQTRLKFENKSFFKFAFCFNPAFNILEEKNKYKLILNNSLKTNVDKKTGLITYEEITDNALRQTRRYYKVELDTDKDFEVNLDDYTEVE